MASKGLSPEGGSLSEGDGSLAQVLQNLEVLSLVQQKVGEKGGKLSGLAGSGWGAVWSRARTRGDSSEGDGYCWAHLRMKETGQGWGVV